MNNDILKNLNKEQRAAVAHGEGPLLIIAGAGTGKTTVIAARIAQLIREKRAAPEEILALTFTEKAAGEMEERVEGLLPVGYLDLWISTFHSFGERILKMHGVDIGLSTDVRILNEFEQWALVKKNLDRFELDYYRPLGNPTKFLHALLKHFSRAKDENIDPPHYLGYAEGLKENLDAMLNNSKLSLRRAKDSAGKRRNERRGHPATNRKTAGSPPPARGGARDDSREIVEQEILRINEVANAYHVYQELLLKENALDFGDLISYTLRLFRTRPAILERYRRQFKYILLDEFQDTNWAQYELVKLLAAPKNNLVVVGDDDQSIYKFRGASVANILAFKSDYPGAGEILLVKNYRSRQNILDLAYGFIQKNNPNRLECRINSQGTEKKGQSLSKRLAAVNKGRGEIEVLKGADLAAEAARVVERIAELKISDKEAAWNDFAILVRANDSARDFCAALEAAGLPYVFYASRGLYAKPVIMDIVAYLKLLDDHHDSAALNRILRLPMFGFTDEEIMNFNYWAGRKCWSVYEVLRGAAALRLAAGTVEKAEHLLGLIGRHRALARERSVIEIIVAFLTDSGYARELSGKDERAGREAAAYLNQFLKRARDFAAKADDKSARAFLAELELEIEAGEEGALAPDSDAGPDLVRVMTVHAAKGLEFDYVFIPNLVDKRFPTIERSEAIPLPDALVKETVPEGDIHLEEERRLFYVAVTRARKGVFFSWAEDYGGARKKKSSRFLEEAGQINDLSRENPECSSRLNRPKTSQIATGLPRPAKAGLAMTSGIKLPSYFSYTQLAAFTNCPYQYRFAHVLKIPRRGKPAFSYGQTMHLALERIFRQAAHRTGKEQADLFGAKPAARPGPPVSWEEARAIFAGAWIDDWYETKQQKEAYRKKGLESLKAFLTKHGPNWPRPLALEQSVHFRLNGYRLYGKVDRIDDLGDLGLKLVDYKTGTAKDGGRLTPEDKEQLLIYQQGIAPLYGRPVARLEFYYLDDNSEAAFTATDKDIAASQEKTAAKIAKIVAAFRANDFPPQPGRMCRYCDFSDICEYRDLKS